MNSCLLKKSFILNPCSSIELPHVSNPARLTPDVYIQRGKAMVLTCSAEAIGLAKGNKSITDLMLSRYKVIEREKIRIFAHYRIKKKFYRKDVCDIK